MRPEAMSEVQLGRGDEERLWRWLRWEEAPDFFEVGRTAWMKLREPVPHPTVEGLTLTGAKVKGIGLWSGDGPPRPTDGEEEYLDALEQPHFGIDGDGRYVERLSAMAPLGGMVLSRALLEYENTQRLLERSVPALVPYAVFRNERRYGSEPLAVVVTLSSEATPFRAKVLIASREAIGSREERAYRLRGERALGLDASLSSPEGLAAGFTALAGQTGVAIRGMTEAGLYRYSGSLANFQYCTAWKRLLLTDLDSTHELSELEPEARGIEILRDVASAVHKIVEAIFLHPQLLRDAGLLRLTEADPILAFLRAYFADLPLRAVRRAGNLIWAFTIPITTEVDRRRRAAGPNWPRDRRKMNPVDKWTLYALTMMVCQPLLATSSLAELGIASRGQVGLESALPLVGDGAVFLRWAESQLSPTTPRSRPAPR